MINKFAVSSRDTAIGMLRSHTTTVSKSAPVHMACLDSNINRALFLFGGHTIVTQDPEAGDIALRGVETVEDRLVLRHSKHVTPKVEDGTAAAESPL